ncbi:MAG: NUDIX hydrolase [Candidatus Saccharimonadota bacterium]|jgi:ADP-ribose pyrophosphatase YjhB (NUDIX family)
MIEFVSVNHHIQKYIIDVLMYAQIARFRDLRPPKVDTNLFTYHLNVLLKQGMVEKVDGGYRLSKDGLSYVDRVSSDNKGIRTQPKIISMLVVQNSDGDILLQRRTKQPYINTWTLPYGKLHVEDESVNDAARREVSEKLGIDESAPEHAGDCYIRVKVKGELLSSTLAHVFRMYRDDVIVGDNLVWARPHKLSNYRLAPAVEEIMARTFFKDTFFFEEYDVEWID